MHSSQYQLEHRRDLERFLQPHFALQLCRFIRSLIDCELFNVCKKIDLVQTKKVLSSRNKQYVQTYWTYY